MKNYHESHDGSYPAMPINTATDDPEKLRQMQITLKQQIIWWRNELDHRKAAVRRNESTLNKLLHQTLKQKVKVAENAMDIRFQRLAIVESKLEQLGSQKVRGPVRFVSP